MYLSQLILDALAAQAERSCRTAIALAIYVVVHRKRNLRATVFETMAQDIRGVLQPGLYSHDPEDCWRPYFSVNACSDDPLGIRIKSHGVHRCRVSVQAEKE